MEYIIQYNNEDKYLTSRFEVTNISGKAARFTSLQAANDFISKNLPKELLEFKQKFKAVKIQVSKPSEYVNKEFIEKNSKKEENIEKIEKNVDIENIDENNAIDKFKNDLIDLNVDLTNFIESKHFLETQSIELNKRIDKIFNFIEINDIEQTIAMELIQILKAILIKKRKLTYCLHLIELTETNNQNSIKDLTEAINNTVKNL